MKKLYNYLLPVLLSLCVISCDEDNEEVVYMTNQDPVATVSSLSPDKGYVGNEFSIIGDEFGIMKEVVKAFIGSQEAEVLSCEENKIMAKVPATASSGKITIEVFGQRVATDLIYTVLGKPGITAVIPQYGFPGDEITFEGGELGVSKTLYTLIFGDATEGAEIVGTPTNESFKAKIPEKGTSGLISLVIADQTVDVSSFPFVVLEHATLKESGKDEPGLSGFAGSTVTLTGTKLNQILPTGVEAPGAWKAMFIPVEEEGSAERQPVEAVVNTEKVTDTTIEVTVPASLVPGDYKIAITTPFEQIETQPSYTVLPTPVVENVTPQNGYVGAEVTISGRNFVSSVADIEVKFGDTPVTDIKLNGANNDIIVKVPALTNFGNTAISLFVRGLSIAMGDKSVFEVFASPVITSVTTDNMFSAKAVQANNTITITGTGFRNSTIVSATFREQPLDITVVSDTKITAKVSADCEVGEDVITLKFDGVETDVASAGKLEMLKEGSDISKYVLTNGKQPFTSVEGKTSGHCTPAGWSFNYGAGSDGFYHDESLEYPGEGLFMNADGGLLVIQTGWDKLPNKQNGKMYQTITLPQGVYDVIINVAEVNVDAGGRKQAGFFIQKGDATVLPDMDGSKYQWTNAGNLISSTNLAFGTYKDTQVKLEDVLVNYDDVTTLGFVVQFANNKCVKVSSIEILLKQ